MGLSVLHFTPFSRGLSVLYTTTSPTPRPMPAVCAYMPLVVMYPGRQRRAQKSFITCLLCIFPASTLTRARVGYLSRIVVVRNSGEFPRQGLLLHTSVPLHMLSFSSREAVSLPCWGSCQMCIS